MDTTTLLIIIIIVLLVGGGGWYGRDAGSRAAAMFSACAQPSAHVSTRSSKAPGKPRRAFVDTPLAFYRFPQRLIQVFEFCRVPQNPRPFAPRAVIDLARDQPCNEHSVERLGLFDRAMPSQPQRPASPADGLTLLRPPGTSSKTPVRNPIDGIPVTAGLNVSHSPSRRSKLALIASVEKEGGWFTAEHGQKSSRSASASS